MAFARALFRQRRQIEEEAALSLIPKPMAKIRSPDTPLALLI
jgi:hypothetical protein